MDKAVEFFESWVKSQKEFLDNWVKSQKELVEHWTEATRKLQEAILSMGASQEGTPGKEIYNFSNKWITMMANSSKVFTEEATRIQEVWKNTVEKQMEISREMVKNLSERVAQTAEEK